MGRRKVKPDLSKAGENPLAVALAIKVNKKAHSVINKFGNPDHLEFTLEGTPFCKLFEVQGIKKVVLELPVRGKELLLYILYSIEGGSDILWIDRREYMKVHGIKSPNTFLSAIDALTDEENDFKNQFIKKHDDIKDAFWINPKYFFKGDRIRKYPNRLR